MCKSFMTMSVSMTSSHFFLMVIKKVLIIPGCKSYGNEIPILSFDIATHTHTDLSLIVCFKYFISLLSSITFQIDCNKAFDVVH